MANTPATQAGSQSTDIPTGPNPAQLLYISLSFSFSLAVNAWIFFRVSGGLFNPAVGLQAPIHEPGLTVAGHTRSLPGWCRSLCSRWPGLHCTDAGCYGFGGRCQRLVPWSIGRHNIAQWWYKQGAGAVHRNGNSHTKSWAVDQD